MRERREGAIRTHTLIGARRCLAAIEASRVPKAANAFALAAVMSKMARTDRALSTLLAEIDERTIHKAKGEAIARCGRTRLTQTDR
jgi:hypothetical protein